MKVVNIKGISKTGKTTTTVAIIEELIKRGYTVGSVKEIHYEAFTIEKAGSNTDLHKKAGADPVTAHGLSETDVMYQTRLSVEKVLDHYDTDYVIIEGHCDVNCPNIVTGRVPADLKGYRDDLTFAVSGVIANDTDRVDGLPAINGMTNVEKLVTLIEQIVPDRMPNYFPGCCSACGTDCRGMTRRLMDGTAVREDCVIHQQKTALIVDGKSIPMVPFVQNMLRSVTTALVSEFDGCDNAEEIVIKLRK